MGLVVNAASTDEIKKGQTLAMLARLDFVDLARMTPDTTAPAVRAAVLPEQFARRNHVAPIGWNRGTPVIAIATPENVLTIDDIRAAIGREIKVVIACKSQIDEYLEALYGPDRSTAGIGAVNGSARATATGARRAGTPLTGTPLTGATAPGATEDNGSAPPLDPDATVSPGLVAAVETGSVPDESRSPTQEAPTASGPERLVNPLRPASDWFGDALRTPAEELLLDDLELPVVVEERPTTTIDQLLLEWGKVTPENVAIAVAERAQTGRSMRDIIAGLHIVSDDDLLHAVAVEAGFEFVDLNTWTIDERAADLIPESICRRYKVIGIGFRADKPVVGIANPLNVFALDDVRTVIGGEIEAVVCPPSQIDEYLGRLFSQNAEADLFARNAALIAVGSNSAPGSDVTNLLAVVDDAPIVKFVNLILRQALNQRASDIHIEPAVDNLQVRFRIDGVLHHVTSAPKAIQAGVTSRLKIMADLDIAEHRIPQDGRISLRVGSHEIDLRVATLPTVHGEKIALRVLDKSSVTLDLVKLGFEPDVLARYETAYRKPYGTILVTGPTGSGKSTTLYATLSKLNSAEKNLITVEDPVEYQLRGVNQVQVSPKAGLTFANALRSILRSDPDVVLVGEIRDRETATIAIEAALTGHLVLTCLHTNDAAGTPMRLIEMGVEPFLVGSALDCVLGQRLARVLCNNCAASYEPRVEDLAAAGFGDDDMPIEGRPRFRHAVGCQACTNTGYHGRMSIQEVMIVTEEIERGIVTRMQASEIQRLAVEQGMRTMRHDGLRKAALGLTSIEEILRVVI